MKNATFTLILAVLGVNSLLQGAVGVINCFSDLQGRSHLQPRSQSANAARELVGWHRYLNLYDHNELYGACAVTPSYEHSYRPTRLAQYFFGNDCLTIQGSTVENRQNNAILADYFGLAQSFDSTMQLKPAIRNFLIDFATYIGYRDWYFMAYAPVVWTKWDFETEELITGGCNDEVYPARYMDAAAVAVPARSFTQAIAGDITWGQVVEGIQFGRITCAQKEVRLSEIVVALGYNFVNRESGHFGVNIRGAIPTGNRPDPAYLFSPVVGNGHHGELGIGLWGHIVAWQDGVYNQIWVQWLLNATHLFGTHQCRSFDLCCQGFGSRYILAKEFNEAGNYINQTVPLINRTTLECTVSNAIQIDTVFMASFLTKHMTCDIGYNIWLKSAEKISLDCCLPNQQYALKGIQNVATLVGPSNATQSCATLFGNNFVDQAFVADQFPPVFITSDDIDIHSAANPRAFTHKIFGNIQYSFDPTRSTFPFIGAGGQVEFEGIHHKDDHQPNKIAVSLWSLWVKSGFTF